jgi:aspartate/methionine/tyrosine aminotransferase
MNDVKIRPDDFMFDLFTKYSRIYTGERRKDFFMLSSGANVLPMSKLWKKLINLEIEENFLYGWYTSPDGFPCLKAFIEFYNNFMANEGDFCVKRKSFACLTLGASQAATIVFDYIKYKKIGKKVLQIGYNYSLFERLSRKYGFEIIELVNNHNNITLPSSDDVIMSIFNEKPDLVVLSVPNNPTGEIYYETEIKKMINAVRKINSNILFDLVAQMYISNRDFINIEKIIEECAAEDIAIISNSFSKTEGVPGFRIGYLVGSKTVSNYALEYQLNDTMNPPTFPIFPVVFTIISRVLYIGEKNKWIKRDDWKSILEFCKKMIRVTTAIGPQKFIDEICEMLSFENFTIHYNDFVNEKLYIESVILENYDYTLKTLKNYIQSYTHMKGGFNFLIKLSILADVDESDFNYDLYKKTGITVLTESCFSIGDYRKKGFWIRISLAVDKIEFKNAINRLKEYLVDRSIPVVNKNEL